MSSSPHSGQGETTRIEILRPSQLIAAELRAKILRGEYDAERLPHEPEFAEQLGVSRHHLREALRLLERDGLVRVTRGHTGGIVLACPSPDVLSRTFEGILARKATKIDDLIAARLVVEPAAAEMAASARTDEDLANLATIIEDRSFEPIPQNNNRFHLAVAEASHNDTLSLIIRSMSSLIFNLDLSTISQENHAAGVRAHRAILRALADRDGERSGRYMRAHILGFVEACQKAGFDPSVKTVPDVVRLESQATRRR